LGIEVEFFPVGEGNGDAITVKYGDQTGFYLNVVDGGYSSTGEKLVENIAKHYGKDVIITHMVVSHADDDHARGLIPVLNSFRVANLWMNRPWFYVNEVIGQFHGNYGPEGWVEDTKAAHEYLVELEAIANSRGIPIHEAFQGAQIGVFTVLAPSRARYISLIPDLAKTPPAYREDTSALSRSIFGSGLRNIMEKVRESLDIETLDDNPPDTSASNETSIVQLGLYDNKKVLLTADVGPAGLTEAAIYAHSRGLLSAPDFVQVPHHGSRRNVTPTVLNAWLGSPNGGTTRGVAFVSLGSNKDDYPRKKVKNAFIRRGYPVYACRNGWILQRYGTDPRPGMVDISPEPFSPDVED
jgi:beta-lactamase superfamily II metal-dependent hydrolase